jgi:hypothetical protein
MSSHQTTEEIYGPGTFTDTKFIPLPEDCSRILKYFASVTPGFTTDDAVLSSVKFEGGDLPLLPGPIKSQAVTAVLFAMAGIVGQEILALRGKNIGGQISINTDHAGLFLNTPCLFDVDGKDILHLMQSGEIMKMVEDFDIGAVELGLHMRSQAIYPTKTPNVWYQTHGSTDPDKVLAALDIDISNKTTSGDEAYEIIKAAVMKYEADALEMKFQRLGLCGSICYSPKAWKETYMGKSLARHPLINYSKQIQTPVLPPALFPETQDGRPLAGIKVVELARIIAAPALGAQLAAFGADVVRVQARDMVDLSVKFPSNTPLVAH